MRPRNLRKRVLHMALACAGLVVSGAVFSQSADALAGAAREAARGDRNRESASLFEQALAAAPERRREWLREYADQLTYSDRATQATPLYREYLAGNPEGEDRRRGLSGLALALSWADRPSEARVVYEALLAQDPGSTDAQRNLGRVMSWSGRQREAQAYLRSFLARHPGDNDARFLLAQSQWWMGRPDSARDTIAEAVPATTSPNDATRGLKLSMAQSLSQETRLDWQRSTQSDSLDITEESIGHKWYSANGLTLIAPRLQNFRYSPRDGSPGVTNMRPGLRARHRFTDDFEANGEAATERIDPEGMPAYSRFTYNAWLTWWASDAYRFDATFNRATFDNVTSLQRGIVARSEGLSFDWVPGERDRLTARASYSEYSDGNRRNSAQVELEHRAFTHPTVWGGVRITHFDFSQQLDNGYFNPLNYNSYVVTLRADGVLDGKLRWSANLAGGREYARPDGDKPVYDAGVALSYRVTRSAVLEARAQHFNSRTASASGFARTTAGIAFIYTWDAG